MRARSSIKLVLASTLPLAIAGCSQPEETVAYSLKSNFKNVQACVDAKFPVDVCSDAYMQAMADHRRIAPTYDDQASCDADFVEGYCQQNSQGQYMPQLGGFELALSADLPKQQVENAQQQVAQASAASGGGFNANGMLAGLLIGQMMSNNSGSRYYSQPVYTSRDSRGEYKSSTLSRQIEQGKTFGRSTQARSSGTDSYTKSTLGRSLSQGTGSTRSSVGSTISRGGFGQQATARSGWSGKSSSRSSFGG